MILNCMGHCPCWCLAVARDATPVRGRRIGPATRRGCLPEYAKLSACLRTRSEQFSKVSLPAVLPAVAGDRARHRYQRLSCVVLRSRSMWATVTVASASTAPQRRPFKNLRSRSANSPVHQAAFCPESHLAELHLDIGTKSCPRYQTHLTRSVGARCPEQGSFHVPLLSFEHDLAGCGAHRDRTYVFGEFHARAAGILGERAIEVLNNRPALRDERYERSLRREFQPVR